MLFGARGADIQANRAEFPFQLQDGFIRLDVRLQNSSEPLHFLLDSGADVSVINLSTVQRLGLRLGRRVQVKGVHATTTGYWPQRLNVGESALPKNYLAVDLSELSRSCRCNVDGLIGADFFRDNPVQIDFAAKRIRVLSAKPEAKGNSILPLRSKQGALLVAASVNDGRSEWFRLDTGCAAPLRWVQSDYGLQGRETQTAVALTQMSFPVVETRVRLGNFDFDAVPTAVHDTRIFPGEAGLLGNGLLSRLSSITVDAPHGRLVLDGPVPEN
jgi:hypothetical protein